MRKHEGKRVGPDAAGMNEVDIEAVDPGMELRELIDEPFPFLPSEGGEPPGQPRPVSRRSLTPGWPRQSRSTLEGLQRVVRQRASLRCLGEASVGACAGEAVASVY